MHASDAAAHFSNSLDFLLHVRAEILAIDQLATLRCVCAEIKQQICQAALSLHVAERAKILKYMAAFPAVARLRLVEVSFGEWATHCAERFALRAAQHIAAAHDPMVANQTRPSETRLVARLVGVAPRDMGAAEAAAVKAMDGVQLIMRLKEIADANKARLRFLNREFFASAASLLAWCQQDAVLPDGRRGIFHASLDSVVDWWAGQGRAIDRGAAFFFLRWFTREFGVGTHPKILEHAMQAHAEVSEMHGFLRHTTRAETADGLLRSLRQQFGAERTAAIQNSLRLSLCHGEKPGVDFPMPEVIEALMALFETMMREIAAHDLPNDKRGILRRKWKAVLSIGGLAHGGPDFQRVRGLVDELTSDL